MVSGKLTSLTTRRYGEEVARLGITEERASEIASEVDALNEAALAAAARLELNDEPGQFPLTLVGNRDPRGKNR